MRLTASQSPERKELGAPPADWMDELLALLPHGMHWKEHERVRKALEGVRAALGSRNRDELLQGMLERISRVARPEDWPRIVAACTRCGMSQESLDAWFQREGSPVQFPVEQRNAVADVRTLLTLYDRALFFKEHLPQPAERGIPEVLDFLSKVLVGNSMLESNAIRAFFALVRSAYWRVSDERKEKVLYRRPKPGEPQYWREVAVAAAQVELQRIWAQVVYPYIDRVARAFLDNVLDSDPQRAKSLDLQYVRFVKQVQARLRSRPQIMGSASYFPSSFKEVFECMDGHWFAFRNTLALVDPDTREITYREATADDHLVAHCGWDLHSSEECQGELEEVDALLREVLVFTHNGRSDERMYHSMLGWLAHLLFDFHTYDHEVLVFSGKESSAKTAVVRLLVKLLGRHYAAAFDPKYLGQTTNRALACISQLLQSHCRAGILGEFALDVHSAIQVSNIKRLIEGRRGMRFPARLRLVLAVDGPLVCRSDLRIARHLHILRCNDHAAAPKLDVGQATDRHLSALYHLVAAHVKHNLAHHAHGLQEDMADPVVAVLSKFMSLDAYNQKRGHPDSKKPLDGIHPDALIPATKKALMKFVETEAKERAVSADVEVDLLKLTNCNITAPLIATGAAKNPKLRIGTRASAACHLWRIVYVPYAENGKKSI